MASIGPWLRRGNQKLGALDDRVEAFGAREDVWRQLGATHAQAARQFVVRLAWRSQFAVAVGFGPADCHCRLPTVADLF
eukprot:scaffold10092_cov66-Phaeocystis_antarctica.AAC.2